jgi:DNA-binding response OmpR family regulator
MDHKRIMVVEDDPGIRDVLEILLTNISDHLYIAPTATAFYLELGKYIPDLFIIDIMLPDGNGVDICEDLKKRKSTSEVPIILMSANLTFANVLHCKADLFVHKPFDIKTFVGGVKSLLN